jgi:phosphatidylglycerophosphate synthase
LRASARIDLAVALALGLGAAWATWRALGLPLLYLAQVAAGLVLLTTLVLRGLPAHRPFERPGLPAPRPFDRLGPANRVTLFRAVATAWLAGFLGRPEAFSAWGGGLVGLGFLLLVLDGVDGRLARRTGMASPFGARFDMEVDAALVLVLCGLAWQQGRAGAWVLVAGLLRYLFVLAGTRLSWMRRDLPPSRRRQAVCVLQTATLVAALAPVLAPPVAVTLAAVGVVGTVASFAVDTLWLYRRRRDEGTRR